MTVTGPIHLDVDITGMVDLPGELHTRVTVYLPDADEHSDPVVVFAFPGGGASRVMYCMEAPTTQAHSQARWHAERGIAVVACDHLGTGDSSRPDEGLMTSPYLIAWANGATVRTVLDLLAKGAIGPEHPRVVDPVTIGVGHSMGGQLTTILQAHQGLFDGIGVLGSSAFQTTLPIPPTLDQTPERRYSRGRPPGARELHGPSAEDALAIRRHMSRWDADEVAEMKRHVWDPPLSSNGMPPTSGDLIAAGAMTEEASWIDVPVFLGFGERDVTRNAWEEPRWYWRSRDVTLAVIPQMSHGMNSARTREMMWWRLHHWVAGVAEFARTDPVGVRLARTISDAL